ncbi:MAG: 16S rRNA (adenine(1518)-N(6)/adenine(1519)-N(6))-dimethyltransferase RsmA [Patescibacteria group bacterium]|jgi:16S rRNA (adenine1518-N6/adenine1519-N6)-dimethyltransferase|nr:16S rRNA (adenine(1518)-N(6)/adenine(1519)-N(6))-dimethyltransferase RsmA [Patescibacteria group bacterium]
MNSIAHQTKELCRLYDIKPARSKGQNFLINEGIYQAIIKAADIKPEDTILEVGPGLGFLTAKIAAQAKRVVAVELDDKLATILNLAISSQDVQNVEVINQDILRFNPQDYFDQDESYSVVANLPYNITSIFLRTFLSTLKPPNSLVLMLQKEVAERIVRLEPDMTLLSLSLAYYGQAEIIRTVPASDFWPAPAVDSAILRFIYTKNKPTPVSIELDKRFFRLARIAFSAKRKMLKNNLLAALDISADKLDNIFAKVGIDQKIRAENLSLENWHSLFAAMDDSVL